MEKKRTKAKFSLKSVSKFIIEKRAIIFLLFAVLIVYCILSLGKVKLNEDVVALLPEYTVTRRAINVMNEEFANFATANVMVSNITYEKADELRKQIEQIDNVTMVAFDDTSEHFASSSALFSVTFSGEAMEEKTQKALDEIKEALDGYEVSISTAIGEDIAKQLAGEMGTVMILAAVVIIGVMIFTSKSYFEVIIMLIVFAVAALLNMGTNYWFGEISTITNSVAVILQLALAIDYAIIFCHRFQDEYEKQGNVKSALVDSLSYSIIEISSSSLTTISGLIALTLMQFRLGYDLGMVLVKGIFCSILTVFLLMPGLIMIFHKPLLKMRHKNFVPNITGWGRLLSKKVPVFLIIFALILPFAIIATNQCDYSFSPQCIDRVKLSEQDKINERITDTFDETNMVVVIVPKGDYVKEKMVLDEISALPEVKTAMGLANIEIDDGKTLTDPFTARQFSELIGIDIEPAKILYAMYGLEHKQYQPIMEPVMGNNETYAVPLIDIVEFLFEAVDNGAVTLNADQMEMLEGMRGMLTDALNQLRGPEHVRMITSASVPIEGDESYALVQRMEDIAAEHYGRENVYVVGDITSARDMEMSFTEDVKLVSWMTILFVFLVIFFTFRSFGAAVLLILVIQGSIWINFAFPYLTGKNLAFISYLIVSAIQMGATIDYAIVMYNRFQIHKAQMPPRDAMAVAVNESFPTIITSGTIMSAAGFIITAFTTNVYIGSLGMALGRGALISMILVMTVLPQILILGNKFMEKTTVNFKKLFGKEGADNGKKAE